MKKQDNNQVSVIGEIVSGFTFNHVARGEGFYMVDIAIKRLSGIDDVIPLMISERLIDVNANYHRCTVEAIGQIRSYNWHDGMKRRLSLSVHVSELNFMNEFTDHTKNNQIFLDGYICKEPIYRKTPFGREITDLLIAVNRPDGKSDYIPCVSWGRNAQFAVNQMVGTHIMLQGRIQSRKYLKRISDMETEQRTAYEVSISNLEVDYGPSKD